MENSTQTQEFKEIVEAVNNRIHFKGKLIEHSIEGFERIIEVVDDSVGLRGIIAIHNTTLGPAVGGIRMYPYSSFEEALTDVLRLSEGMTFKSGVAQTGTGGGKSVIIGDPKKIKTPQLLRSFGAAINALGGTYIGAEDSGMRLSDLGILRERTRFLVGIPHPRSSGDPSPFTVFGGLMGIKAAAKQVWGSSSLKGKRIAIQGLGAVGLRLAEVLFWEGARLVVTDVDRNLVDTAVKSFKAEAVEPHEIFGVACDIFAPCALGGILNPETIPQLKCRAVAGLANNQLLTPGDGEALFKKGILYAPDYVINSGGLYQVCVELEKGGYDPTLARDRIATLYSLLTEIFELSAEKKLPTHEIANEICHRNLTQLVGKRTEPIIFHH